MSGVANPSPASGLTALNIFNAVKLEKLIACIDMLILTALVIVKVLVQQFTYMFLGFGSHLKGSSDAKFTLQVV